MSYRDVLDGLNERFETVATIEMVLDYEPTSVGVTPLMYSLLDTVAYSEQGQVHVTRYRILHRLCLLWQENEYAEQDLVPFVNSVPSAVEADPQLGGRIGRGIATIGEAIATFVTIGGTVYRCLDFYSDVVVKRGVTRT